MINYPSQLSFQNQAIFLITKQLKGTNKKRPRFKTWGVFLLNLSYRLLQIVKSIAFIGRIIDLKGIYLSQFLLNIGDKTHIGVPINF